MSTLSQPFVKPVRITSLDGLRGLTILFVMVHHFGLHLPGWADWGPIAPNIFFLLSGYLITLSVMKMQKNPKAGQLFSFHMRRLVRLLPALYAMLLIGWITGLSEFRDGWVWHISFLTNIQMAIQNDWVGYASHLWSLSIQEQFYLFWPLLLLLPTRWLVPALFTTLIGATVFRIACLHYETTDFIRWFLLPGSLDAFAAGGFIAWIARTRKDGLIISPRWRWAFLCFILSAWWLARAWRLEYGSARINIAFIDTMETLVFSGLLIELLQYQGSMLSKLFSNKPLCFLGKISYGLYLWHMLVSFAITPLLTNLGLNTNQYLRVSILIGFSILAAWISWTLLERPFIEMGRQLTAAEGSIVQKLTTVLKTFRQTIYNPISVIVCWTTKRLKIQKKPA